MSFKFDETMLPKVEDFVIENNVIKGVEQVFDADAGNIGQIFLDALSSKPNYIAQIDTASGKQTTFAQIKDRSIQCGIWLKKQGIGIGDIVALCTDNHLDTCIPILASLYTGSILNIWTHDNPLKPARRFMQLFQPKIIFSCESSVEVLLEAAKLENAETKIIVFGKYFNLQSLDDIIELQSNEEVQNFSPTLIKSPCATVGLILLSSGSTGLPKGVMHSYGAMLQFITSWTPYPMKDVSLWYSTPAWVSGYVFILCCLLWQGTRIIHANFEPENTCRVIEKYKVRRLFASPLMINYFYKSKILSQYKLKSLEVVQTGGSKINPNTLQKFKNSLPHVLVVQVYGCTEIGYAITFQTKNSNDNLSVGIIRPCSQLKILDIKTKKKLGVKKEGELYLKTPALMLGYYKNEEGTKEVIDDEGWFRTGDKVYYDGRGQIFIVDRMKEVMKCRNYQISPTEIEEVLLSHPDVVEAAVVPIPHELDGDRPIAFVKKVPDSNVTEEELVKLSASLGETKKLWGGVKFLNVLPKTASGKIAKPKLKEMVKALTENMMKT